MPYNWSSIFSEELRQEQAYEKRRIQLARLRNSRRARQPPTSAELEEPYPDTASSPPYLPIKFGRVDCHPTSSNQTSGNQFPRGEAGLRETLEFFRRKFHFSARETVALLGMLEEKRLPFLRILAERRLSF